MHQRLRRVLMLVEAMLGMLLLMEMLKLMLVRVTQLLPQGKQQRMKLIGTLLSGTELLKT